MIQLSEKNILFLTHSYSSFQKDQIEIISNYFNHVYVLVRYKPISEISGLFPFNFLRTHRKKFAIQLKDKPKNINVIPVPLYYLPTKRGYVNLGKKHLESVENILYNNRIKFDIIHAHFLWSAGFVGSSLKNIRNIPFVVTAHGYDIYKLPFENNDWYNKIRKVACNADSVITVSKRNVSCLEKLNVFNCHLVPNGFNENIFYPKNQKTCRDELGLSQERKIILTIGNLTTEKGHFYLIESIKKLIQHVPDILCIIIGNGKCYNSLKKQIDNLKLYNNVMLVGEKFHHELSEWLNACNLFVLPSISESFGIVQLEAMACGKPVVATINGGSESLITSQDVGLLCEKENPQDMAAKIFIALEKSWDEKRIREYASLYTLDSVCKKIVAIYQDIL